MSFSLAGDQKNIWGKRQIASGDCLSTRSFRSYLANAERTKKMIFIHFKQLLPLRNVATMLTKLCWQLLSDSKNSLTWNAWRLSLVCSRPRRSYTPQCSYCSLSRILFWWYVAGLIFWNETNKSFKMWIRICLNLFLQMCWFVLLPCLWTWNPPVGTGKLNFIDQKIIPTCQTEYFTHTFPNRMFWE